MTPTTLVTLMIIATMVDDGTYNKDLVCGWRWDVRMKKLMVKVSSIVINAPHLKRNHSKNTIQQVWAHIIVYVEYLLSSETKFNIIRKEGLNSLL